MKKLLKLTASLLCAASFVFAFASCKNSDDGDSSGGSSPEVTPGTVGEFPESILNASALAKKLDANNESVILFWYDASATYSKYTAYNWIPGTDGDESKMVDFVEDSATSIAYANFTQAYSNLTDEMTRKSIFM